MDAVYQNSDPLKGESPRNQRERYRGVSYTRPIDAAKEKVRTIDLADLISGAGNLRRIRDRWVGKCPLPDHDEKSPSFTVYLKTDSWFCFGCHRGGDVVELARHYWRFSEREAHAAAGHLLLTFGYELPQRPPSWFAKRERQKGARELLRQTRIEVRARRYWKYVYGPVVDTLEDEKARHAMAGELWPLVRAEAARITDRTGEAS